MIRQGIVDRLDVGIVDQFLIRAVRPGNAQAVRGCPRLCNIPRCNGDHLCQRASAHPGNDFLQRDVGGAEYPPANGGDSLVGHFASMTSTLAGTIRGPRDLELEICTMALLELLPRAARTRVIPPNIAPVCRPAGHTR